MILFYTMSIYLTRFLPPTQWGGMLGLVHPASVMADPAFLHLPAPNRCL